ncbi:MAG: flippase [Gemmatimonadetes bacterium]|nr:flippase [Gemmatimonadota bacterium]
MKRVSMVRNILLSGIARASDAVLLLLLVLAARQLGDERYGRFAFGLAFVGLFEVAADFGLRELVIREVGRDRGRARWFVSHAMTWKAAYAALTTLLVGGITWFLPVSSEQKVVIWILLAAAIFRSFRFFFRSVLVAHEAFGTETRTLVIERTVLVLVCGGVLLAGYGLVPFALSFAAVSLANTALFLFVAQRSTGSLGFAREGQSLRTLFQSSVPFWLTAAAMGLYFKLDSVMLSFLRGDAEVGWYNAAYRIIEGTVVIPSTLYYALFPRLSALYTEDPGALRSVTERGLKAVIGVGFLMAGLGTLLADPLMLVIYGSDFAPSGISFRILSASLPFFFGWSLMIVVLNSVHRANMPFLGLLTGSLLNVALNLWLIPRHGYVGASIATAVAEVFLFAFLWRALGAAGYRSSVVGCLLKPAIAASVSIAVVFALPLVPSLRALLFGLLFAGMLSVLRFVDGEERAWIAERIRRIGRRR